MFKETSPQQRFVEITSSNEMIIPNGHVLGLPNKVEYINLKTKHRYFKTLSYINDTKNVNDNLYNKYIKKIERFDRFGTDNPSSNFSQM